MAICWRCGQESDQIQEAVCPQCRLEFACNVINVAAVRMGTIIRPVMEAATQSFITLGKAMAPLARTLQSGIITANSINTSSSRITLDAPRGEEDGETEEAKGDVTTDS